MKTPPSIEVTILRDVLTQQYDLHITNITFLPCGEDNWGYRIDCADGSRYLKVYWRTPTTLDLLAALQSQYGFTNAVVPLPTVNGVLQIQLGEYTLALFEFIDAPEMLTLSLSDVEQRELGRLLAQLHRIGEKLTLPCPREDFNTKDVPDCLRVIEALPQALHSDNPHRRALAEMLLPLRERLLKEIADFEATATRARGADVSFVLCHGDPTGGNILVGEKFYFIDWDGVILAPKERDLNFFVDWPLVLEGYAEVAGNAPLDETILAYYRLQWNAQEIADYGVKILFEEQDEVQYKHDLFRMEDFLSYSGIGKKP
jgi:spectinomycin phosphotransferase